MSVSASGNLKDSSEDLTVSHSAESMDKKPCSVAVKKKKTCRGLSSSLASKFSHGNIENLETENIYSGRVAEVWRTSITECEVQQLTPHQAETNDIEIINIDKSDDRIVQKSAKVKNLPSPGYIAVKESASIAASTKTVQQPREPTPPPSPVMQVKKRRVTKDVKLAMSKLEKAKKFLQQNVEDNDVMIIDDSYDAKADAESSFKDSIVVKIKTRSGIHRHTMKMRDSFADVFEVMAKKEHVTKDLIMMFLNDRTVHTYDSPKSLELTVADILDCHVRGSESAADDVNNELNDDDDPMTIKLALQSTDSRAAKCYLTIRKDEPMEKIMRQYCEIAKIKYSSVKFCFDGEQIDPSSSPESLDLETDYCIDVLPVSR